MGWLVLWTLILLSFPAMLAANAWRLWRKGRALVEELAAQGRTLGELGDVLGELEFPAESGGDAARRRAER